VWVLELPHQSQAHSQALYCVDQAHKDRLRVLVYGHHRSIVHHLVQDSLLMGVPHEEMVDMEHCSKHHGVPRGQWHSLVGNCGLALMGSPVRSPRCVHRSC
jgi:hypothetical protein